MATKFGKYAIVDPVTFNFSKEEKWWWRIKPATTGEELAIRKFYSDGRVATGPDGIRREYFPNIFEQAMREIALTFGGTNIPLEYENPVETGGEPVLKTNASVEEIEAVLRTMTPEMVLEIWDHVGEAVPGWGPIRTDDPNSKRSK